jgi:hypothetical protein
MLIVGLVLSASINVFLLFYVRWLLKNLTYVSENMDGLWVSLREFSHHVQMLHETDMFYGDSNLQALIEHSRKVTEDIDSYKVLLMPPEEDPEEEDIEEFRDAS